MFNFFVKRRLERLAYRQIVKGLRFQIIDAIEQDKGNSILRLQSPFIAGYIYWYVRIGFSAITNIVGEKAAERHVKNICNEVFPNVLFQVFNSQLLALEISKKSSIHRDSNNINDSNNIKLSYDMKMFEIGTEAGIADASHFRYSDDPTLGVNLNNFLLGKSLDYKPLS